MFVVKMMIGFGTCQGARRDERNGGKVETGEREEGERENRGRRERGLTLIAYSFKSRIC
jgi:hypothetical protein